MTTIYIWGVPTASKNILITINADSSPHHQLDTALSQCVDKVCDKLEVLFGHDLMLILCIENFDELHLKTK